MDESHRHENYKRSIRKAHGRKTKKQRTREEQKLIRERSRARKAGTEDKGRGRKGGHVDPREEEEAGFERMRRARELPPLGIRARDARTGASPERAEPEREEGSRALVCGLARGRAIVLLEGRRLELELGPALSAAQQGRIAVGDEVRIEELGPGARRVASVLPRRSFLARPDPADPRRELLLAANLDLAVIVLDAASALRKLGLVDRFLVALARGGVAALLCVNKVDCEDALVQRAELERALAPYAALGAPVHFASALRGDGIDSLRAALRARTCVFIGQSGVGKSSLLNAIDPAGERLTRSIRERDGRGRHATSASSLRELEDGTRIIDTPGIRSFALPALGRAELEAAFPELARHAPHCRYSDCSHLHEPDCATRAAVEAGLVERARYESYARILRASEDPGEKGDSQ